jgi:hypothetical protein
LGPLPMSAGRNSGNVGFGDADGDGDGDIGFGVADEASSTPNSKLIMQKIRKRMAQ